jgi:plastocyanin
MLHESLRLPTATTLTGGLLLALVAASSGGSPSGGEGPVPSGANPPFTYYTITPCRMIDTRGPDGPLGGPALVGQADREFSLLGAGSACSIPPEARAVSVNVTVTEPQAAGNLRLYPGDQPLPLASTLNYSAGQTRGNNAIVLLSLTRTLKARAVQAAGTTTHMILDVNGYFAPPADLVIEIAGIQGPMSYSPNPASVSAGQTVSWHNADSIGHTATEDTGTGFDTGFIAPGATSPPLVMTQTGMFPYHCTIHPSMVGRLDVN